MGNKASSRSTSVVEAEDLLTRLSFLRHYWKEVGETLRISDYILEELEEVDCRLSPKRKFEHVITKWVEENQCRVLLPQLRRALLDADFVQKDNGIHQRLQKDLRDQSGESNYDQPIPRRDNKRWCSRCCCLTSYLCCSLKYLLPLVIIGMLMLVSRQDVGKDLFDKFFEENDKEVNKLVEIGGNKIRILVTGKTGTGKSALINGIMGDNVTVEGGSLDPMTTTVDEYKRAIRGVPMIMYDSPGLQDGTKNEKEYLLDMERKCKEVHLVLYTLKMSDRRLQEDDANAMEKLTHAFGEQFWEKAMFVLTFANEVRDPDDPDDDAKNMKYFEIKLEQWEKKLTETVEQKLNVSKNVATKIPAVPAGYRKHRDLPGRKYWFTEFLRATLNRMHETNTDGYRLTLAFQKDRFKRAYEVTPDDFDQDHEQPFVSSSWFSWPWS